METKVSVFRDISDPNEPKYVEIDKILNAIKNGTFKDKVEAIRNEKDKGYQNKLKQGLVSVLFSSSKQVGVESGKDKKINFRTDRGVDEHSGFICIDLDKFPDVETMMFCKESLKIDKYVYSVFVSPSGEGLKVIVKIPKDIENHRGYFYGLKEYFDSPYFDDTSVNPSRVCYVSHDDELHLNKDSEVFNTIREQEKPKVEVEVKKVDVSDQDVVIKGLMKWWSERYGLVPNKRNTNTYILAMAFNEFGIPELTTRSVLSQLEDRSGKDPFTIQEINRVIESAYSKSHLFNTKSFTSEEEFQKEYKPSVHADVSEPIVNFQNIYSSAFIDVTKKIEYPPVAISIGSHTMNGNHLPIPFGTYGNFSCIVGASKSKKTFLKSLITASFIGGKTNVYAPTIRSHRDRECFVIDLDTEQSLWHAQNVFKRVMRLVGANTYEYYKPFALRPYEPKQRLQFLEWLIYESELKDNIGFVAIDGLADLVEDFNDLKESQAVIQKVMKWTDDKQFHLTTILHSNFGTTKAVGHIGSSMLKKAETVCQVSNEGDYVKAHFSHTRGFPIADFCYAVNENGLPYILGENSEEKFYEPPVIEEEVSELPTLSVEDAFDVEF